MINAVKINQKDNVVVIIEYVKKGEIVEYKDTNGNLCSLTSKDDIRIYHKICIENIKKGMNIIKYGEHIGIAARDILVGEHIHDHNVKDNREDLRKKEEI